MGRKPHEIAREKALSLSSVDGRDGGWLTVYESFAGAWQQDVAVDQVQVMSFYAVFSCITLIANDIGKLRAKLVEQDANGIWTETTNPAFTPVLRKPNRYQNHIQFRENWMCSKLSRGNAYALKQRDSRRVVTGLYLLDPSRVTPLVAPDGSVYYQLGDDNLANIDAVAIVPASEIIHDRMNCLFHPLVGLSPIYACGLAATQGLAAQKNSARFFTNMSRPSGVLTAPGTVTQDTADRLKAKWELNYTGENFGKVAVLGDGLKYERISVTAVESQMLEQLKWTAEVVCSCFHVPPFKIGIGQMPTYQNAEILNQIYYSDCLQSLIEQFEACMDEGLGLDTPINGRMLGVELDLDGLLRMDTATKIKTLSEGIKGAVLSPNEARKRIDLKPLPGGDSVFMQQQNWSLEQLDKRDIINDKPAVAPPPAEPEAEPEVDKLLDILNRKAPEGLTHV
ncbi:MAG: phage portal protein [Lentisphaerae bacterium]|nr:phage portal protein [Lentisphaerota bacterium]